MQEFNKGVYDYIIATDESGGKRELDTDDVHDVNGAHGDDVQLDDGTWPFLRLRCIEVIPCVAAAHSHCELGSLDVAESSTKRKRHSSPILKPSKRHRSKMHSGDKEYGVTRGIDFVNVACVVNFDLPTSYRAYTHRVGRTARAGHSGMSLSFVIPRSEWGKNKVVGCVESSREDEQIWGRIENGEKTKGSKIQEYKFDMEQVEAFRYRMGDALRSVTKSAIKEARIKELKTEILNSEKLKVWKQSLMVCKRHSPFQGAL